MEDAMSRLVRVPQRANENSALAGLEDVLGPHLARGEASTQAPETYLERIAKYVPAEVLAFFIFINAILEQAGKTGGKGAAMAGLPVTTGALAVGLLLTPLFVWYVRQEGDAWITNAVVSTAAFPFWAYVLGAVAFDGFWDGNLAAILLATFTVVSGLVAPRMPKPKKAEAKAPVRPERRHLDLVEPSPA